MVSQPDELESFQHLATGPIRRPLGTCSLLPGNERRPSAIKNARRNEMESPVSFRTKYAHARQVHKKLTFTPLDDVHHCPWRVGDNHEDYENETGRLMDTTFQK